MLPIFLRKSSSKIKTTRHKLSLIECLVFGLPCLFFLYINYKTISSWANIQIVVAGLILLLILSGLVMIRQFFERIDHFSNTVQKAAQGRINNLDTSRVTGELQNVAGAFNDILLQMKNTNKELSRKVEGLSVMKEMLAASAKTSDIDYLLKLLLEKSMSVAEASIGSVFAIENGDKTDFRLVNYKGPGKLPFKNFPLESHSSVMQYVAASKKPLLVENIETDPRTQKSNNPKYESPSFLSIPILAGDQIAGILNLANKCNYLPFDSEDEQLLSLVVKEMGFTLQNALLVQKLKKTTLDLQQSEKTSEKHILLSSQLASENQNLNNQLVHAEKMQALGTLAGGVAHDFNNLLMAIQGNVSLMLLETSEDHAYYGRFKNIEKQIGSGSRLTRRLLGFARKSGSKWKTLEINCLLNEVAEAFGRTRKDISVQTSMEQNLWPVEADPDQIEQVLWNLFINASDAMPSGGSLFLKTKNATSKNIQIGDLTPRPGRYVMLAVSDTGVGIDADTISKIFEPFFTTKDIGKGTGLGLASVYGIVKSHGGYVVAESPDDKGAVFSVFLPASDNTCSSPDVLKHDLRRGSGTILLVEDEEHVRTVDEQMLVHLGYTVLSAANGKQAVQMYSNHKEKIQLVLLDLVMPEQGGVSAFHDIISIDPAAKILLSSGVGENDPSVSDLRNQCLGFIQKPFSLSVLSQTLEKHIKNFSA